MAVHCGLDGCSRNLLTGGNDASSGYYVFRTCTQIFALVHGAAVATVESALNPLQSNFLAVFSHDSNSCLYNGCLSTALTFWMMSLSISQTRLSSSHRCEWNPSSKIIDQSSTSSGNKQ